MSSYLSLSQKTDLGLLFSRWCAYRRNWIELKPIFKKTPINQVPPHVSTWYQLPRHNTNHQPHVPHQHTWQHTNNNNCCALQSDTQLDMCTKITVEIAKVITFISDFFFSLCTKRSIVILTTRLVVERSMVTISTRDFISEDRWCTMRHYWQQTLEIHRSNNTKLRRSNYHSTIVITKGVLPCHKSKITQKREEQMKGPYTIYWDFT
jgi:hypothetical protein